MNDTLQVLSRSRTNFHLGYIRGLRGSVLVDSRSSRARVRFSPPCQTSLFWVSVYFHIFQSHSNQQPIHPPRGGAVADITGRSPATIRPCPPRQRHPALGPPPVSCCWEHGCRDSLRRMCGTRFWRGTDECSRCCSAGDRQQQPDRQRSARHSDSPRKITERLTLAPGARTVRPG